jgi:GDP-4-dehydro-6-deoxy-D-mannose reductase
MPGAELTIAVTGATGFVGGHLVRELTEHHHRVIGLGREPSADLDDYIEADLTRSWPRIPPVDAIIHLAGLADVGASFGRPQEYIVANSAMVTHLGEYCLESGLRPRILGISTGAVYAPAGQSPLAEDFPLSTSSPYVVSKRLVETQLGYYASRGLDTVVARPFNHVGPGQRTGFLIPDLVAKVRAAMGAATTVTVGNLATERDYTDVRDVVAAYRLLATTPRLAHDVYNVCSGRSVSGLRVLEIVRSALGANDLTTEVDATLLRPADSDVVIGDADRLRTELRWMPTRSLEETIRDIVAAS